MSDYPIKISKYKDDAFLPHADGGTYRSGIRLRHPYGDFPGVPRIGLNDIYAVAADLIHRAAGEARAGNELHLPGIARGACDRSYHLAVHALLLLL